MGRGRGVGTEGKFRFFRRFFETCSDDLVDIVLDCGGGKLGWNLTNYLLICQFILSFLGESFFYFFLSIYIINVSLKSTFNFNVYIFVNHGIYRLLRYVLIYIYI